MDSIENILRAKAAQLDLGVANDITLIQIEIDRLFGKHKAKVQGISKRGDVFIVTPNASLATEMRFETMRIHKAIQDQTKRELNNIVIRIGTL